MLFSAGFWNYSVRRIIYLGSAGADLYLIYFLNLLSLPQCQVFLVWCCSHPLTPLNHRGWRSIQEKRNREKPYLISIEFDILPNMLPTLFIPLLFLIVTNLNATGGKWFHPESWKTVEKQQGQQPVKTPWSSEDVYLEVNFLSLIK